MSEKKLLKRKRDSINEAAEEEMASLTDSDTDNILLSWKPVTGVSTEKLLIQMAKEIGVIKNQVCWYFTFHLKTPVRICDT